MRLEVINIGLMEEVGIVLVENSFLNSVNGLFFLFGLLKKCSQIFMKFWKLFCLCGEYYQSDTGSDLSPDCELGILNLCLITLCCSL